MQSQNSKPFGFTEGAPVQLVEKPDGHLSHQYPLTVGSIYTFLGWMNTCVIISTDEPGQTASIHYSRVAPVPA